ncbi:MAG TPA: phage tail tape measure protein [Beijerinckiaceae bacterium]
MEFLRRAGASANVAGISAEQTLAFGAALKEVGVRTETAATGFEALLNLMKLGGEFSKKAGEALKALGLESDAMRKAFVAKPVETMLDLLNRIKNTTDPMKRAEILTNLFGKEYQDDIAKLLNALPRLTELLDAMANKAKYANSVMKGFEIISEKDFNKIDRMSQAIDTLATRAGKAFKQIGGLFADQMNRGIDDAEKILAELRRREEQKRLRGKIDDEDAALAKPGSVQEYIRRQEQLRDASRNRAANMSGMARLTAAEQVKKTEAEIVRLRQELITAQEKAAEVARERAARGANARRMSTFSDMGPTAPHQVSPGLGAFGFGPHGTGAAANGLPLTGPTPPVKPVVDTSEIEATKAKAAEAKAELERLAEQHGVTIDSAQIVHALSLAKQLNSELARVEQNAGRAAAAVSHRVGAEARKSMRALYSDTGAD